MNKDQLQAELLQKVKAGIKPSDLKKLKNKNGEKEPKSLDLNSNSLLFHHDEGYESEGILTPPPTPPLKPTKKDDLPPSISITEQATIRPKSSNKPFHCPACRSTKREAPVQIKVASTDPEYNLIKGKVYSFCSQCSPKIKEFNEYDLITPELWEKYPYSEAKEILELEFNIQEVKK